MRIVDLEVEDRSTRRICDIDKVIRSSQEAAYVFLWIEFVLQINLLIIVELEIEVLLDESSGGSVVASLDGIVGVDGRERKVLVGYVAALQSWALECKSVCAVLATGR